MTQEEIVPRKITVTRRKDKPDYIQFEVDGRPIVEGYLYPVPVTMTEPPVEVTTTKRGFHVYGEAITTRHDEKIHVYESSNATGPHVWLAVVDHALGNPAVELNPTEARDVITRLQTWLDDFPTRWN